MERLTQIALVRHGETVWNRERRYQGHADSALTPKGRNQTLVLGEWLASHGFDAIYSSDLPRAVRSAELIRRFLPAELRVDSRLRERHLGVLQGLTATDASDRHPDAVHAYRSADPDVRIPGGESRREHYDRIVSVLGFFAASRGSNRILIVTHGGSIRCVACLLGVRSLADSTVTPIPNSGPPLQAVFRTVWEPTTFLSPQSPTDSREP